MMTVFAKKCKIHNVDDQEERLKRLNELNGQLRELDERRIQLALEAEMVQGRLVEQFNGQPPCGKSQKAYSSDPEWLFLCDSCHHQPQTSQSPDSIPFRLAEKKIQAQLETLYSIDDLRESSTHILRLIDVVLRTSESTGGARIAMEAVLRVFSHYNFVSQTATDHPDRQGRALETYHNEIIAPLNDAMVTIGLRLYHSVTPDIAYEIFASAARIITSVEGQIGAISKDWKDGFHYRRARDFVQDVLRHLRIATAEEALFVRLPAELVIMIARFAEGPRLLEKMFVPWPRAVCDMKCEEQEEGVGRRWDISIPGRVTKYLWAPS